MALCHVLGAVVACCEPCESAVDGDCVVTVVCAVYR